MPRRPASAALLVLALALAVAWGPADARAQEKGPLMMNVEVGFALGGMVGGAGVGFVVWLTDPGGPVSIGENVKSGAVLGTLLGSIAGFYILYNATIAPEQMQDFQELENLLGAADPAPVRVARLDEPPATPAGSGYQVPLLQFKF